MSVLQSCVSAGACQHAMCQCSATELVAMLLPRSEVNINCVFQDWMLELSMQQQSVLVLACRGPDGIGKFHPTKVLVSHYRASVLKSAWYGRPLVPGEGTRSDPFMTLEALTDVDRWFDVMRDFFDNVDAIPHHYYLHLMHGAEIIGYHHPELTLSVPWRNFYLRCCHDLHVHPEGSDAMDHRLGDWKQKHWGKPAPRGTGTNPLNAHYETEDKHL